MISSKLLIVQDIVRVGLFTLKGQSGEAHVNLVSDSYVNMIDNSLIDVKNGILKIDYDPIVIQGQYYK